MVIHAAGFVPVVVEVHEIRVIGDFTSSSQLAQCEEEWDNCPKWRPLWDSNPDNLRQRDITVLETGVVPFN